MSLPQSGIAPQEDNNTLLRRILWCLWTLLGLTEGGHPGALPGGQLAISHAQAGVIGGGGGPNPAPANLLVAANPKRRGALLRNLDPNDAFFYGSDPNVNDATGAICKANESVPIQFSGPIYIYAINGTPQAELIEVVN